MKENDYATLTFCPGCRVKVIAIQGDQAAIKIKGDNTARLPLSELTPCEFTGLTLPVWLVEGAKVEDRANGTRYTVTNCGRSFIDCAESDGTVSRNRIIDFLRYFSPINDVEEITTEPTQPKEPTTPTKTDDHPTTTVTPPSDDDMAAAANLLFGGLAKSIKKDLLKEIMAKVQPILDRAPVRKVIQIADGPEVDVTGEHVLFTKLLFFIQNRRHVFIYGPAGAGKSYVAQQLAKKLNLPFYQTERVQDSSELSGYPTPDGHLVETPFYKAFTGGGLFNFDEVDSSDDQAVNFVNSALANKRCTFPCVGNVTAHPDFVCICGANTDGNGPSEAYSARNKLDAAFLNRFTARIEFPYDPNLDLFKAGGDKEIVNFAVDFRKAVDACGLCNVLMTPRNIESIALMSRANGNLFTDPEIIRYGVLGGLDNDTRNNIYSSLSNKTNRWAKALKTA